MTETKKLYVELSAGQTYSAIGRVTDLRDMIRTAKHEGDFVLFAGVWLNPAHITKIQAVTPQ